MHPLKWSRFCCGNNLQNSRVWTHYSGYMNKAGQQEGSFHQINSMALIHRCSHLNTQCQSQCGKWKEDWHIMNWPWSFHLGKTYVTSAHISLAKASPWPCLITRSREKCNPTFVWKRMGGLYINTPNAYQSRYSNLTWLMVWYDFPWRKSQHTCSKRG